MTSNAALRAALGVGLLLLASSEGRAQSCSAPAFPAAPVTVPVGAGPRGIAVLDINRDGSLDLVTADASSGTISFGYGDGMGGLPGFFTSPAFSPQPWAVAVSDFNLDGTPDVAIADLAANVVQALLGDGLGTVLAPSPPVGVGAMPMALATGDFNRDGIPDLVSANASGSVQIVIGNGNGTFVALAPLPLGGNPQDVVAGDFNRDGFLDAAVADAAAFVHLALGNGAGGWLGLNSFGVAFQASSLAAGDLDLDGDLDVVVGDAASPALRTLIGDGGPNLFPQPLFPGPLPSTTSVVLADFDSDGRLDLGTASFGNTGVAAALGDGAGGFTAFTPFGVPQDPFALAAGDFDGDGRPDLVGSGTPVNQAVLLVNLFGLPCPNTSFARAGRLQVLAADPTALASGDWNSDGIPDLVSAVAFELHTLTGDGVFGFSVAAPLPLGPNEPKDIAVADLDLDGDPDLAISGQTTELRLFENVGGTFVPAGNVPLATMASHVVSGDFNRDGKPDVVSGHRLDAILTFHEGQASMALGPQTTTVIGLFGMSDLTAGDFNGDQNLDVAVTSNITHEVHWFLGDGAGNFAPGGLQPVGNFPVSVAVGDLNGDPWPDLAVANALSDDVAVLLNQGGAGFLPPSFWAAGDAPRSVVIGETNGDGNADLAVVNRDTDDVTIHYGDGGGGFPTSRAVLGYNAPELVLLVDADRNGARDLVVANKSSLGAEGSLTILPGDGLGDFGPVQVSQAIDPRSVASGDFDRDGRPDLVTLDLSSTEMSFLRGQGDGTFSPATLWPAGFSPPRGIGVGDFDGNGTPDVVLGTNGPNVVFLPGDGAGGFGGPGFVSSIDSGTSRRRIGVGDFDRDGALDFVRVSSGNNVVLTYGNGDGTFAFPDRATAVGGSPYDLVVLDFNRDGVLDVAVSNFGSNTVMLLQGTATLAIPRPITPLTLVETLPAQSPAGIEAGDFDHDGFIDLVVAQFLSVPGKVAYFRGRPQPPPAVAPFFLAPDEYDLDDPNELEVDGMAVADVNGDGLLDAIVTCRGGPHKDRSSARVLVGTGDPTPGLAFRPADTWKTAQRRPWYVAIDDFNRDGKPDFFSSELGGVRNVVSVVLNSNCHARRLKVIQDVSRCGNTVGTPFGVQPVVQVEDDGANPILCNAEPIDVAEKGGAPLSGTTSFATTSGVADWSTAPLPLFMNDPGKKYRLQFSHLDAGLTFGWTFTVEPPLAVTGPDGYCAASSGFFSTDLGFDTYRWYVNPPWPNPLSYTPSLTVGPGALSAGPYVAQVDATVDSCPVGASKAFDVFDDLSSVTVAPPAPQSVCTTCTGGNLTATETDGGAVTRRWGYRATPGGAITYLPGETGPTYLVDGADFPGQGTYYVVVETTPQCGVVTVSSNEVEVTVEVTAVDDVPPVFAVTSTDTQNRLEWAYPPGRTRVRIRYDTDPVWLNCTPPPTEADGFVDIPDQTAPATFVNHGSLTNDLTYCYSIFVETSPGVYPVTTRQTTKGRPFDTSGPVKWAYSTGATSMAPPGLGLGVIHVVSNDEILHSVAKGLGGGWPVGWIPFVANGPSQSRPSTVGISVPPAGRVVYLGSQVAAGNNSLAVDADSGMGLWGQPLGLPVQAGPAGIFSAYGGSMDAILLGTFDGGSPNAFHALDPWTGNPLPGWPYGGEALNEIGRVSAQAAVDYFGDRVFFTSYHHAAGTDSVWCVDLATGSRCPLWPVGVTAGFDHVAASPTLRGGVLYVAPINGEIHALDADDATPRWGAPFLPVDGQVKLFVLPDFFSTDLYFSTVNSVWSIRDDGGAAGLNWERTGIPNPSQPVYYPGTGRVWVGASDGNLYILNSSDGLNAVVPIVLGDGNFAVGAPTVDRAGGFVYVGTDAGVVYAVAIP